MPRQSSSTDCPCCGGTHEARLVLAAAAFRIASEMPYATPFPSARWATAFDSGRMRPVGAPINMRISSGVAGRTLFPASSHQIGARLATTV
eukprot:6266117-Prymnesium_polylepis.1